MSIDAVTKCNLTQIHVAEGTDALGCKSTRSRQHVLPSVPDDGMTQSKRFLHLFRNATERILLCQEVQSMDENLRLREQDVKMLRSQVVECESAFQVYIFRTLDCTS